MKYLKALLKKLNSRLHREAFLTSPLAMVVNPSYIIRDGLYKNILTMAPAIKGRILDLGCGSKPYESLFVNADSYTGVDIEVSGHNHKKSKVDYFYDGKTLPFPDDSFDSVVSFEVFEHIFNIDEVLAEIRRVLKPGGQILISIPFAWFEHEVPYDFARYTSYGIKHVFEKNAFEVTEIKKTTTFFLAVCQMFIGYLTHFVLPQNQILARFFQLVLIFPLTVMSVLLNGVFPKRYEYFCNILVCARKLESNPSPIIQPMK